MKFTFYKGTNRYELEFPAIETRFESYILFKASTTAGLAWLKGFNKGGLQTIALVMHFFYDDNWCDTVDESQEDELLHLLSSVKIRLFNKLFH
jgi:hypothetical protein